MRKKKIKINKLDYINPEEVLIRFQDKRNLIFLDSANKTISENNRYSYIAFDPIYTIKFNASKNYLNSKKFARINKLISSFKSKKIKSLPKFQCGLAGYVSYEAGLAKEKIESANPLEKILPNLFFGLFDIVIAFDNKLKRAYLFSINLDKEFKIELSHQIRLQNAKNLYSVPRINNPINKLFGFQWKKDFDKRKYISKINKILNYIKNGDIFQANFTQRFLSKIPKDYDVVRYYLHYRKNTETPFSCLIRSEDFNIFSYSPERFLKLENNKIMVSPIKGTIERGESEFEDAKLKEQLSSSKKDNAENLMIVDVLRNDISEVCKPGTVKVSRLAELETYNNVHHLVSDIEGTLSKGMNIFDVIKHCMPGGSVTGAPKVRAMQIISELETFKRGVYCGAIGFISFSGYADFNIPIRTITVNNEKVFLNSGGGIVADSKPLNEYHELNKKVENLLQINKKSLNKFMSKNKQI